MAEKLTDIELTGIVLDETKPRIGKDPSYNVLQEDGIETALGTIHVAVQGDRSKPAILTYHDIGLNHSTCFQGFFNFNDMQPILRHFCIYHVNAPGQHEGAATITLSESHKDEQQNLLAEAARRGSLPKGPENKASSETKSPKKATKSPRKKIQRSLTLKEDNIKTSKWPTLSPLRRKSRTGYPTMDQLADMLLPVLQFYQLKRVIGFGVGAGANILTRFALTNPEKVDALFLVECVSTQAGWSEWFYQNVNTWYLKGGTMTGFTEEYLLWHWFGKDTKDRNYDLVLSHKENIKLINPNNLAMFIDSYMHRTDLGLVRPSDVVKKGISKQLKCNVMLITGSGSPHVDDVIDMNGRLDPSNSQWMKVSDCGGMPLEEQPAVVSEVFRLFLQGMGYVPTLSQTKIVVDREVARRSSVLDTSSSQISAAPLPQTSPVC